MINYIVHLSDIHIMNDARYDEFHEGIMNLEILVKKVVKVPNETVIIITGDIMDAKTELSPEAFHLGTLLFKKLSKIAPLIIIPGNHDCNLSNPNRLDAISPIVAELKGDIYYWKETKVHTFDNLSFTVISVFDETLIKASEVKTTKKKICLYHGIIHKSLTDVGSRMHRDEWTIDKFEGYDYLLLGDIHRYQYLNDEKTFAYAGSLFQKNFGETLHNHGFIFWNLKNKTSKFYELHNDYGYITLKVKNGKISEADYKKIPKKPRIKFMTQATTIIQFNELLDKLKKEFDIQGVIRNPHLNVQKKKVEVEKKEIDISSYLKEQNLPSVLRKKIISLHDKISEKLDTEITGGNQNWEILKLEFSNMLSYGRNNVIDFTKYDKNTVIGIMAPNHYGKSAILDILLFCLFDTFSRGHPRDILNKNQDDFKCALAFQIGSKKYRIERGGRRKGPSVNMTLKFFKYVDGKKTLINAKTKLETNKKIVEMIGGYNDYLSTCFSLQDNHHNFLQMKQMERKDFLNKLLRLNVFEQCHQVSKDKLKKYQGELSAIEKQINKLSMSEMNQDIKTMVDDLNYLKKQKSLLIDYVSMFQSMIKDNHIFTVNDFTSDEEFMDEIKNLQNSFCDVAHSNDELDNISRKLEKMENMTWFVTGKKHLSTYKQRVKSLPSDIKGLSLKNLEKQQDILEEKMRKGEIHNKNIDAETKKILTKLEKLDDRMETLKHDKMICKSQSLDDIFTKMREKYQKYVQLMDVINFDPDEAKILEPWLDNFVTFLKENEVDSSMYNEYLQSCHISLQQDNIDNKKLLHEIRLLNLDALTYIHNRDIEVEMKKCVIEKDQYQKKLKTFEKMNVKDLKEQLNDAIDDMKRIKKLMPEMKKIENEKEEMDVLDEKIEKHRLVIEELQVKKNKLYQVVQLEKKTRMQQKINRKELELLEAYYYVWRMNKVNKCLTSQQKAILESYQEILVTVKEKIIKQEHEINLVKRDLQSYLKLKKEYDMLSDKINVYQEYIKMTHNNGLPYKMIVEHIPLIQSQTNVILSEMVEFTIELKSSAKGYLDLDIEYPDKQAYSILLASGFEKFIVGLVLRMVFSYISLSAKPNFLIIDEGWSCMDKENLAKVDKILNYLRSQYSYVIIISHLEQMKNQVNYKLDINKKGGYSFLSKG